MSSMLANSIGGFFGLCCGIIAGVFVLFWVLNRISARIRRRTNAYQVEVALEELVDPDSHDHDEWQLFLNFPIDDPYLESIRQRCAKIVEECPRTHPHQDISDEGVARVAAILEELRAPRTPAHPE